MYSLPTEAFYQNQSAIVFNVTTSLTKLSNDIDSYSNKLAIFERDVKKLKTGMDVNKATSRRAVENRQTANFKDSLVSLTTKMADLKNNMD